MIHDRSAWQIIQSISGWIAAGEIGDDGSLPSLKVLAELFGVSVMTVRAAIIGLETVGIVRMAHGKGVFVVSPRTILESAFRTRRDLEALMARRAAVAMSDSVIEDMRFHVGAMQDAAERRDANAYRTHDAPFHAAAFRAADSPILGSIVTFLKHGVFSFESYALGETLREPSYLVESNKIHWDFFDAMVDKDPDRAEAAVHRHLDRIDSVRTRSMGSICAKAKTELAQIR